MTGAQERVGGAKLSAAQVLRREFNRWFARKYQDADGGFTHIPRWFKADMWEAWQAGRAALKARSES